MNLAFPSRRSAFTLVELLVVIAVIGVLAGLLMSVLGTVQESGNRTKCLNNLHQIGIASLSFESDNNGSLPGPCDSGQKIYYTTNMMVGNLAPYLGLPSTATNQIVETFRCPTWRKKATQPTKYSDNIICYITDNEIVVTNPSATIQVNGYPASGTTPAKPPGRASNLAGLEGLPLKTTGTACGATSTFSMTETMYITECDQVNWAYDSTAGWYGALPKTPVHGSVRNTLFFDMHAAARPVAMIP